jgi:hypothetical protein
MQISIRSRSFACSVLPGGATPIHLTGDDLIPPGVLCGGETANNLDLPRLVIPAEGVLPDSAGRLSMSARARSDHRTANSRLNLWRIKVSALKVIGQCSRSQDG